MYASCLIYRALAVACLMLRFAKFARSSERYKRSQLAAYTAALRVVCRAAWRARLQPLRCTRFRVTAQRRSELRTEAAHGAAAARAAARLRLSSLSQLAPASALHALRLEARMLDALRRTCFAAACADARPDAPAPRRRA